MTFMRRGLIFLVALFTLVAVGSARFVSAQDSPERSPKPSPSLIRQETKERIEERKENQEASKEARFCELRKTKIKAYFVRMTARLEALIERLQKLIDRIESRIDKIEESGEGEDLTNAKADLATAKALLADTKTKLTTLKTDIDTFLTCDDPKGAFKIVRGKVDEIKDDLKEVHKLLTHIIGDIKGLRIGETEKSPKPSATP